jgi:GNAT superfamily N-acetyltransferase
VAVTVLGSAAEVLLATDHDPFARGTLRRPVITGWLGDGAVAWLGTDAEERVSYLSALGRPAAVAALIGDLAPELRTKQRVTLPRGTAPLLPAWVELQGTDWDFRWTATAPQLSPAEERVVDVADLDALRALLDAASPGASVQPGDEAARRWVGVPGPEGLLACTADTSAATGVGHLSAVAVHPSARGLGLGYAVTAALTRRLLTEGCDVVTLGMYADNDPGRALYDALGFRDEHRFTSGPLTVRSRW